MSDIRLQQSQTPISLLIEFRSMDQVFALCAGDAPLAWNGVEYMALGNILQLGDLHDKIGEYGSPFEMSVSLPTELATKANLEGLHGTSVRIKLATLNSDMAIDEEPLLLWAGIVDVVSRSISMSEGTTSFDILCLPEQDLLNQQNGMLSTHGDQQLYSEGDNFYRDTERLAHTDTKWQTVNITHSGGINKPLELD